MTNMIFSADHLPLASVEDLQVSATISVECTALPADSSHPRIHIGVTVSRSESLPQFLLDAEYVCTAGNNTGSEVSHINVCKSFPREIYGYDSQV